MRINLLLHDAPAARSGYLNVDGVEASPESGVVFGDPFDLSHTVDEAEAEEILALDVVSFLPRDKIVPVLAHWASRLARGGRLVVGAYDVHEIALDLVNGVLAEEDADKLLYGEQQFAWEFRRCAHSPERLASALEAVGLRVESTRVVGRRAVVVAMKP